MKRGSKKGQELRERRRCERAVSIIDLGLAIVMDSFCEYWLLLFFQWCISIIQKMRRILAVAFGLAFVCSAPSLGLLLSQSLPFLQYNSILFVISAKYLILFDSNRAEGRYDVGGILPFAQPLDLALVFLESMTISHPISQIN
jgi:hypothetical protein